MASMAISDWPRAGLGHPVAADLQALRLHDARQDDLDESLIGHGRGPFSRRSCVRYKL